MPTAIYPNRIKRLLAIVFITVSLFVVFSGVYDAIPVKEIFAWDNTGGDHGDTDWVLDGESVTISGIHTNIANLTISGGSTITVDGGSDIQVTGTFNITGASTVYIDSLNNSIKVDGAWVGEGSEFSATTFNLSSDSSINGTGRGYVGGTPYDNGPGGPGGSYNWTYYSGGSYGGVGGALAMPVYGSNLAPVDLGSGGQGCRSAGSCQARNGGAGGSAIKITATNMDLEGEIVMNGIGGSSMSGGGAGGSIYLDSVSISGSGDLYAIGGNAPTCGSYGGGAGGGGRIAIYYMQNNLDVTPTSGINVAPGSPGKYAGNSGTVYLSQKAGFTINSKPADVDVYLASDWSTDVNTDDQYGPNDVGIEDTTSGYRAGKLEVNFNQNLDWSELDVDVDTSLGATLLNHSGSFTDLPGRSSSTYTMYIPQKTGHRVGFCPGLTSISGDLESCENIVYSTPSTVEEGGVTYWVLSGLNQFGVGFTDYGNLIQNLDSGINAYTTSDWVTSVESNKQWGTVSVGLTSDSTRVVTTTVDFSQDRDWSNLLIGSSSGKAFVYYPGGYSSFPGASGAGFILYVPKSSGNYLGYCPSANSLESLSTACSGFTVIESTNPAVSEITIGEDEYWQVSGVSNGGLMSLEGYYVTNMPSGLSAVQIGDWTTSVTANRQFGDVGVGIEKDDVPIASLNVRFNQSHDWSGISASTDVSNLKAFMHYAGGFTSIPGVIGSGYSLYIPKGGKSFVGICPGASNIDSVDSGCEGLYYVSERCEYVSVVTIDDTEYWRIDDLTSTGAFSSEGFLISLPEASEDPDPGDEEDPPQEVELQIETVEGDDVTEEENAGEVAIRITDGVNRIVGLQLDVTENIDLSDLRAESSENAAFFYYPGGHSSIPGVVGDGYSLYIRRDSDDDMIGVCTDVTNIEGVNYYCSGIQWYTLADDNVSTETIDGDEYWILEGLTDERVGAFSSSEEEKQQVDEEIANELADTGSAIVYIWLLGLLICPISLYLIACYNHPVYEDVRK